MGVIFVLLPPHDLFPYFSMAVANRRESWMQPPRQMSPWSGMPPEKHRSFSLLIRRQQQQPLSIGIPVHHRSPSSLHVTTDWHLREVRGTQKDFSPPRLPQGGMQLLFNHAKATQTYSAEKHDSQKKLHGTLLESGPSPWFL